MSTKPLIFYLGQVVQTVDPIQFNSGFTDDETGESLPPGSILVRLSHEGTSVTEEYAVPADQHISRIPLYGEQVILFGGIDGKGVNKGANRTYYLPFTLNVHNNINNNVMPFMYDNRIDTSDFQSDGISILNENEGPGQLSFDAERDIVAIQPLQGDTIIQSRYGSVLRFSGTHAEIDGYKEKPFFRGSNVGDPFISLTCEVDGVTNGDSLTDYYKIEKPDNDGSFIYMSSTQTFTGLSFAQDNLGKEFEDDYDQPQVIIGSDRLIFNAKEDQLILVSATDVKVATPNWATDMDEFFSLVEEFMEELDKIVNTKETIATGAGPTGIATNAAKFTNILSRFRQMKQ
jgi:hypothetical protein